MQSPATNAKSGSLGVADRSRVFFPSAPASGAVGEAFLFILKLRLLVEAAFGADGVVEPLDQAQIVETQLSRTGGSLTAGGARENVAAEINALVYSGGRSLTAGRTGENVAAEINARIRSGGILTGSGLIGGTGENVAAEINALVCSSRSSVVNTPRLVRIRLIRVGLIWIRLIRI